MYIYICTATIKTRRKSVLFGPLGFCVYSDKHLSLQTNPVVSPTTIFMVDKQKGSANYYCGSAVVKRPDWSSSRRAHGLPHCRSTVIEFFIISAAQLPTAAVDILPARFRTMCLYSLPERGTYILFPWILEF